MGKNKNPKRSGKARRQAFLRKIQQIRHKQRGESRKSDK